MYFPAVPISDLSDPARYRTLPRRSHLYLGETVRFLLVLRSQNPADGGAEQPGGSSSSSSSSSRSWRELAGSLCAVASVCPGDGRQRAPPLYHDYQSSGDECVEDTDEEEPGAAGCASRSSSRARGFRECKPLLIHNNPASGGREFRRAPLQVRHEVNQGRYFNGPREDDDNTLVRGLGHWIYWCGVGVWNGMDTCWWGFGTRRVTLVGALEPKGDSWTHWSVVLEWDVHRVEDCLSRKGSASVNNHVFIVLFKVKSSCTMYTKVLKNMMVLVYVH